MKSSLADFKDLYSKLSKSSEVQNAQVDTKKALLNTKLIESLNNFFIRADINYNKGTNPAFLALQAQTTTQINPSLTFGKKFSWGGELSFTSGVEYSDISEWDLGIRSGFANDSFYFARNTLTYTQDLGRNFLGDTYKSDLEKAKITSDIFKTQSIKVSEDKIVKVFTSYIRARLLKKLKILSSESFTRSKSRSNFITKRYKDGILTKADYLRAQGSTLASEDRLLDVKNQYLDVLNDLSDELDFEVNDTYIADFIISKNLSEPESSLNLENLDINLLNKRLKASDLSLKKANAQSRADVKLSLSFSRASSESSYSEAFDQSVNDDFYDSKRVSLNLIYPLGDSSSEINKEIELLENQKIRNNIKELKANISRKEKRLSLNLKDLVGKVATIKKRVSLGKDLLQDQNKRYKRGQVDLDKVLSAEDELLLVEQEYYRSLSEIEILKARLWSIYGQASKALKEFNG